MGRVYKKDIKMYGYLRASFNTEVSNSQPSNNVYTHIVVLYSHIHIHIHNTNISGNIVNNNDDFNERTNTLLYKNISLTLYSRKGWCWLCVRDELETGTDWYILTPSSSDHSSTSSSFWLGLLNRGSLRAQSPLSAAGSHFGILSPTDSSRLCAGYIIV